MKASVVIPTYNSEKFIDECLCSIKDQTFQDFECIVVDDGSADGTVQACREFARSDSRFKVVCTEHSNGCGAAKGRNTGLAKAQGEYVQFVDSDDTLVPEALEESIGFMERHGLDIAFFDAEAVSCGAGQFDCWRSQMYMRRRKNYGILSGEEMFCQMVGMSNFICYAFLYAAKRTALKHPFPLIPLDEDLVFTVQNLLSAVKAGHLPKALYRKRCRPCSTLTSPLYLERTASLARAIASLEKWGTEEASCGRIEDSSRQFLQRLLNRCQKELEARWNSLDLAERNRLECLSDEDRTILLSRLAGKY